MYKILQIILFSLPFILFSQDNERDSLQNVIKTTKNDSLKIEAYNKLFFKTVYSDPSVAKKYYETLFILGKKNPYAKARANNLKGIYLDVEGQYDSAYVYYKKAIQIATGKFPNVEGSAYNNIGLIYWNRGSFYNALKYFGRAQKLFEKIGNQMLQANVLSNIGLIYYDINNPKKAEYYARQSLKIREKIQDEYGISVSLVNLGIAYQKQGNYKASFSVLEKAVQIKKKLDDEIGLSNALYNLAHGYYKLKQFDKSLTLLREAELLCINNNSEANNLANIYTCLADVYVEKKETKELKNVLGKLSVLLKKNKDERNLAAYYGLEATYNSMTDQYKNAFFYQKKADSVNRIVEGMEVKKAINLYETQYQTEKKEKELVETKNTLLEQKTENHQKTIILIIAFIILGFGIVISFLIYRTLKIKNKQQKQEYELQHAIEEIAHQNKLQEQRLSISRDLHDNIGAQLTFIISSIETLKQAFHITDEKIGNKLNSISNFTKDTITELRDTIWAMNHSEIDFNDIRNRIMNFVQKAQTSNEQINIMFDKDSVLEEMHFSSIDGMNIYRITQEAINNAIKYAEANHIIFNVTKAYNQIEISIKDDGKGFDVSQTEFGNGIRNMQKRASELNSKISIESEIGKGTSINLLIPKT